MQKWWLIAILLIIGAVVLGAIFFRERVEPYNFVEPAEPYAYSEWIPGAKTVLKESESFRGCFYGMTANPDRDIIRLSQGCPHSTVTTGHGYHEELILELPKIEAPAVIDIAESDVVVSYNSSHSGGGWPLKPGTARGILNIKSISDDLLKISFDIKLTTIANTNGYVLTGEEAFKGEQTCHRIALPEDPNVFIGYIIQVGPVVDTIHLAASRGDLGAVRKFLTEGVNVNTADTSPLQEKWTALHHSSYDGHTDIVQFLLANGADVNSMTDFGCTPLHNAADRGRFEIVKLLITNGADVNACRKDYGFDYQELGWKPQPRTPIDMAEGWSGDSYVGILEYLRKHGGKRASELSQ